MSGSRTDKARLRTRSKLELKHLRSAVLASDCGSFRRAAELLSTRHSVLSRSIAELECLVGTTLFERSAKGVKPTPGGQRMLRLANGILEQIDTLIGSASAIGPGSGGHISIGLCRPTVGGNLHAALLEFSSRFPQVDLEIIERPKDGLLRCLHNGTADLIVAPRKTELAETLSHPLWTDQILILLRKDCALAARDYVSWTDLFEETVLFSASEGNEELNSLLASQLLLSARGPTIKGHDLSQPLIRDLVSLGKGVGFILESDIGTIREDVICRPFRDGANSTEICFCAHWLSGNRSAVLKQFLALLVDYHPPLSSP
jgi:DNA-binding transcriptional LysR family regulator